MTIKYEYQCNNCQHNYIEQRGNDEPNPYFVICNSCGNGEYQEINKTILAAEPERLSAPIENIIEEPITE